jgi:23S rRNA (cytidine1920-2'-O)/16S rRNA (cytidine1409-2'-O)-methyltransferase
MTRRAGFRDCTYRDPVCNRELESAYSSRVGRKDKNPDRVEHATPGANRSDGGEIPARPTKLRADVAVFEQGLAPSRERAQALILAGQILMGDRPVQKAGESIPAGAALRLRGEPMPYVSRGGLKLAHGLDAFQVNVQGAVAVDIGASTGGFTDCLLQRGAARVYCVDVGHGQLDWKIASDPRVVVIDRTNIRHMEPGRIPERCTLAVIDVSFISLRLVLPALPALLASGAPAVVLVKPQFEVGRDKVGKGGIVRDEADRRQSIDDVAAAARALGMAVLGETTSPITGGKGNVEFLLHLKLP